MNENPYEEMPVSALRAEITRLSEALDKHLTDAKRMLPFDPEDSARDAHSAWLYVSNAVQVTEHLRYARGALAAKEDAEKVRNASAVVHMLLGVQATTDEENRRVMAARDYLRDVMGAK